MTVSAPTKLAWVYILRCSDDTLYTGWAWEPGKRFMEHNEGRGSKYVRSRRPATMVYTEGLGNQSVAMRREAEIKNMTRAQKESLIQKFQDYCDPNKCEACKPNPKFYPLKMCVEHGCKGGCGCVRLGDGDYCGGEDGEVCTGDGDSDGTTLIFTRF